MTDWSSSLHVLGARYREAAADRDEALEGLRAAIRDAVAAGTSKNEAIRASGLARQTVYDALR